MRSGFVENNVPACDEEQAGVSFEEEAGSSGSG
jgi:hypothetical protein